MEAQLNEIINNLRAINDLNSPLIRDLIESFFAICRIMDDRLTPLQRLENELKRAKRYEQFEADNGQLPAPDLLKIFISVYFEPAQ